MDEARAGSASPARHPRARDRTSLSPARRLARSRPAPCPEGPRRRALGAARGGGGGGGVGWAGGGGGDSSAGQQRLGWRRRDASSPREERRHPRAQASACKRQHRRHDVILAKQFLQRQEALGAGAAEED